MTQNGSPTSSLTSGPGFVPEQVSYDVRVWSIRERSAGKKSKTGKPKQEVRWKTGQERHSKVFDTFPLADGFRSKLRAAADAGQPFDVETGLPLSMIPKAQKAKAERTPSCFELAISYSVMKWESASPGHRRGIAEAMAGIMLALVNWDTDPTPQELSEIHTALAQGAFKVPVMKRGLPPEYEKHVRWIEANARDCSVLADTDVVREVLARIGRTLDGTTAAESTFSRKRATFFNFLRYLVEKKHLEVNPLLNISWTPTKNEIAVDRRRVVGEAKGRRLLIAASQQGATGMHLLTYYACLFLGGLRPGEAAALTEDELDLPDDEEDWGWLNLADSSPETSGEWTDSGEREIRQLKHRSAKTVRPAPVSPLLGKLLRWHLSIYGTAPDGRLFRSEDGGLVVESTVNRIWKLAREAVLSKAELKSVQAERPYDLRHARLSLWLNAGVDSAQVAEWAGNSVAVLLRVYIHCVTGSQDAALAKLGRKTSDAIVVEDLAKLDRLVLDLTCPDTPEPVSIFALATAYASEKRETIQPDTMRGVVEALTKVVLATLTQGRSTWPEDVRLGKALTGGAFSDPARATADGLEDVLAWISDQSPEASVLKEPERLSEVLTYLRHKVDGSLASRNVYSRRRSVLFNFLEYAIARGQLPTNPLLFWWWE